jgi:alpha-amylase
VYILNDEQLLRDFNRLQASDHFYYMCTKLFSDGVIHKYFTPYDTPYEAFINYMNVLSDFIQRVNLLTENTKAKQKNILKKKEGTNASKALDKKEK